MTHPLRRLLIPCSIALAATLLGACASRVPQPVTPPPAPLPADQVRIVRTAHGVPHISAGSLQALAFGVAYAHAQDNICQSLDTLTTVRGERSYHFGANGTGILGVRALPNAVIDTFIRSHMDDERLAQAWASQSADSQALSRGYVMGFNRYLQDNLGRLPAACNGKPWVSPMKLSDLYRATEAIQVQAGAGALADAIVAARPPAVGAGPATTPAATPVTQPVAKPGVRRSPVRKPQAARAAAASGGGVDDDLGFKLADARAALREAGLFDSPLGSNAWAFGRDVTANGRGMLLGNPHFPWVGPSRFYQMHLTVPGRLDAMGASLGWTSLVQIGFNRDVAWSHTVSTGKRFTLHELALVPGDPTAYLVDGKPEKMTAQTVRYTQREASGEIIEQTRSVWRSRFGPILVMPRAGLNWTATTAYALQDANAGNLRANDQYLAMNQARSVRELHDALGGLGTSWVNTIAADRHGEALYADKSVVPDVDAAQLQRCAPSKPAQALLGAAGLVVLDGSRSDCNWQRDGASPQPGLIAPARLPSVLRTDWVHNSNDSYWHTQPAVKWADAISPLVGDAVVRRARTRSELIEIPELVARGPVTLAAIQAQLFEGRNLMARQVLPDLLAACPQAPTPEARDGCGALKVFHDQGMRNDLDARGAHVFREFWRVAAAIPRLHRVPGSPTDPLTLPTGLNMADATTATQVWDALTGAVKKVRSAGFALDARLGDVQRAVFTTGPGQTPIGVPGGDDGEGVLNNVGDRAMPGISPAGIRIDYGTSYVQTVTFDERGPVAHAILTYGQSTNPASPHATDQLKLFAAKQWPRLPFHHDEVRREQVGEALHLLAREGVK